MKYNISEKCTTKINVQKGNHEFDSVGSHNIKECDTMQEIKLKWPTNGVLDY